MAAGSTTKTTSNLAATPDVDRLLDDAPQWVWHAIVNATVAGQVSGYDLGFQHGINHAQQEAEYQQVASQAAAIARAVVTDPSRTWAPPGQPQRKGMAA